MSPRLQPALFWVTAILIITVVATATYQLLSLPPMPGWWFQVVDNLPDYLVPENSGAKPLPTLLTVLGGVSLLALIVQWILHLRRQRPTMPRRLTQAEFEQLTPKERLDALQIDRGARLQRITTWGVVFGLMFTAGGLVYSARTWETTQQGQITDRYMKAVEQLGSKSLDVQVGAIYALERIARDSPQDRQTITDVLGVFVHRHDPKPEVKFPKNPPPPRADVAAALTVLARNPPEDKDLLWAEWLDLHGVRIPSAYLMKAAWPLVNLYKANLAGAILSGADLEGATLGGANLMGAYLTGANMHYASLIGANLHEADLEEAGLDNAYLDEADLTKANLTVARLPKANLNKADLTGAILSGADLAGASLHGAHLDGADLTGANLAGATGLPDRKWLEKHTKVDKTTKF